MYGVIDIGSNTIRMVIYKLENGRLRRIMSKKDSAGLAACVSDKNALTDEGIEKAAAIISDFVRTARYISPLELYPFATASLRNVANTDQVLDRLREKCGVDVRILTGREEALFSYSGACGAFMQDEASPEGDAQTDPASDAAADTAGTGKENADFSPTDGILSDIGGGSTEIVCCSGGEIVCAGSISMGSLNTFTKYVHGILPDEKEQKNIRRRVREALVEMPLPEVLPDTDTVLLVGGSARGTLELYNREKKKTGDSFPLKYIKEKLESPAEELERSILKTAPDRIHTLVPGMIIIREVARRTGCRRVKVSPYGVREGYLYSILKEKGIV